MLISSKVRPWKVFVLLLLLIINIQRKKDGRKTGERDEEKTNDLSG
jgi:hypothetical protein